ncbi:MAG: hypothetical protein FWE37_03560 [Spirochaetaceae bacterium]|nr:hypothetical protein [Spirochaetaceae bacterium]
MLLEILQTIFMVASRPLIIIFYIGLLIIFAIVIKIGKPKKKFNFKKIDGFGNVGAKLKARAGKLSRKPADSPPPPEAAPPLEEDEDDE